MTDEPTPTAGSPEPDPLKLLEQARLPSTRFKASHQSERPRCRRFNLGDGMLVTAALAVWLAYIRYLTQILLPTAPDREVAFTWEVIQRAWVSWLVMAFSSLLTLLTTMSLAFIVMRLRQPRPPLRETLMQPGMLGCLVVLLLFLAGLLLPLPDHPLISLSLPVFILTAWITAASRGWLRPEAGWLDRMGRTLAAFWCLSGLFSVFLNWR